MTDKQNTVPEITDLDAAFGTTKGLPEYSQIPKQFKDGSTKWNKLFSDAFYSGIKSLKLAPKNGIDSAKAWRHIRALMGSFQPRHEHKEAGCAYLMSQYFSDATWERA